MPKVYVPSLRYRRVGESFEPATDISSAEKFGEIVHLTTPGNGYVNQEALDIVDKTLDEQLTDDDYILMVGDVLLLSRALATQGEITGNIKALKWDPRADEYVIVKLRWLDEKVNA